MTSANFSHKPAHFASRSAIALFTRRSPRDAFTLVEMLVAISITLVMMATVVGVFATVSSSVSKRRAAVEVGNQLRHVRNVLQRDLEGATCPAIPWQKPESDVGYFEVIEGIHADFYPSLQTDGVLPGSITNPEIDHTASTVPSSSLPLQSGWVTDGGGLGDWDDVLAFTSRNEKHPFTGPAPGNTRQVEPPDPTNANDFTPKSFEQWRAQTITSPVAEVVWFCVENPASQYDDLSYFGEPGMRTIYRRTLLVAPWLDFRFNVDDNGPKSRPGVLRIIDRNNVSEAQALAALIAFQERYDISARIEFDPAIDDEGRWTIVANTLADLTDRKNRFEHFGYTLDGNSRVFANRMISPGVGTGGNSVRFFHDPDLPTPGNQASAIAIKVGNIVVGYDVNDGQPGQGYVVRPFAATQGGSTPRAMINENGQVVYLTNGLVPLGSGSKLENRRGADLMMSDALAFDIQVYDPVAPIYAIDPNGAVLQEGASVPAPNIDLTAVSPADIGWLQAFRSANSNPLAVSSGAYVDLGYSELHREYIRRTTGSNPSAEFPVTPFSGLPHGKSQLADAGLTRTYDTWNFAYENDAVNQDGDVDVNGNPLIDEGTDGFDTPEDYGSGLQVRYGADDNTERETSPPYPAPMRAVQVKLRVYEPDSRQIREVTVRQHFVPE